MSRLLTPGINLMKKMNFLYKFGLISLAVLVPLMLLSALLVMQTSRDIGTIRAERVGIEHAKVALELRRLGGRYVDLVLAIEQVNKQMSAANDLTPLYRQTRQQIDEAIKAYQAVLEQHPLGEETQSSWTNLLNFWQQSAQIDPKAGVEVPQHLAHAEQKKLLELMQHFILAVSIESGLILDSSPERYLLISHVLNEFTMLAGRLEEARAVGTSIKAQTATTASTLKWLEPIGQKLLDTEEEYHYAVATSIGRSPRAKALLEADANKAGEAYKGMAEYIESVLMMGEEQSLTWEGYYNHLSAKIDPIFKVGQSTLPLVDTMLVEQESALIAQRNGYLITALVVLALVVYLCAAFASSMKVTISSIYAAARGLAQGDTRVRVAVDSKDELGSLSVEFNSMAEKVAELISQAHHTARQVSEQAETVERIASRSSDELQSQLSETAQVATAMNEMAATVQEVARSSVSAADSAQAAHRDVQSGRQLVESTSATIRRLAEEIGGTVQVTQRLVEHSHSISKVVDVIKGVAEQTNLLALNAAIEAARAGEQGRGFAVVADEVRTLAQRTQQSTSEIEQMIGQLQTGVNDAVKTMGSSREMTERTVVESSKVDEALASIAGSVDNILGISQQIATAAEEQSVVAREIDRNIVAINGASEHTASGARETVEASQNMAALTQQLEQLIGTFKV